MKILKIASIIILTIFIITGINTPGAEDKEHPIINILTELIFFTAIFTPLVYILLN